MFAEPVFNLWRAVWLRVAYQVEITLMNRWLYLISVMGMTLE